MQLREIIYSVFLLLILVFPTSFREVKIVLMCAVFFDLAIGSRLSIGSFDRGSFLVFFAYLLFCLFFIALGIPLAEHGSLLYVVAAYILAPIFWTLFLASYIVNFGIKSLLRVLIFGGIGAACVVIAYFFFFETVPLWVWEVLIDEPNVTLRDGVPATNLHVISTLIFVAPAFLSSGLDKDILLIDGLRLKSSFFFAAVAFLFTLSVLVSGRTALIVIYFCAVLYGISKLSVRGFLVFVAIGIMGLGVVQYFGVDVLAIGEFVYDKIMAYGGDERRDQHRSLLEGFARSPLIGWGHGTAADLIRNDVKPWQYELYYQAMLFHTGIFGFVLFILFNIYCMWRTKIKLADSSLKGQFLLVGAASALLASYTNPYIEGIESVWMFTLPWAVAVVKYSQLDGQGGIKKIGLLNRYVLNTPKISSLRADVLRDYLNKP
jgi:hypothetical protein